MSKYNEEYGGKGLSGLKNLGNTCFINSIIQIISHTYELNHFLSNSSYETKLNKNIDSLLLIEWDKLRQQLWKKNAAVSPNKFIKTIQEISIYKKIDTFAGFAQNDTSEFLLFLIDCFHNALCRKVSMEIKGDAKIETDKIAITCFKTIKQMYETNYSEMLNLFYGSHISIIRDVNHNIKSMISEPFFILNLPIPPTNKSPTLLDCFDLYVSSEILEGDNAYYDETSKEKIKAYKKIDFWNLPDIIVIVLKRFNSSNRKKQILVDCPLENLDLSKYIVGYNPEKYKYDLYGVCEHSGSVLGGHYTAQVKTANNNWYKFNDMFVTPSNKNIITSSAYCLFYRKQ